jgi:hypothetical protein
MNNKTGMVPGDVILKDGGGIAVYKGKIYRIDMLNPVDGYRLRNINPANALEAESAIWAPAKDVVLKFN